MGILALAADERIADVEISEDELSVRLRDRRKISVPLTWYPRLLQATEEQRTRWQIAGGGYGIHWEEIDEDLSAEGLLRGAPAPRSSGMAGKVKEVPVREFGNATESTKLNLVEKSDDVADKGILDHVIQGEEAATELTEVLLWIQTESAALTVKVRKHTSNIDRLAKNRGGSTARDYKKVVLMAASDMNTFSRRVEEVIPKFAECTEKLDQSYSVYVEFVKPEVPDDVARVGGLHSSLAKMLEVLRPVKKNIANFRDSTRSIRQQNMNKELNRAADLQVKTLNSLLTETERIESFALRISFQINERFGEFPTI